MKCSLFKTIEKRKRTMMTPRVAAIHDMSGFGRCSLTVAIPILSAMGVQCCPLPTAFLSTHTGGVEGVTFLDMTDEMSKVADHWASLGLTFQAVYSGFLGSERQIGVVENFICRFRGPDTVVVVDPVMVATSGSRLLESDAATALREDTEDIKTADLSRSAVVIGSEGRGVSPELLAMSQRALKIPMRERCESLNAAAAATVVLWEMARGH